MTGVVITIDDAEVRRALGQLQAAGGDLRPAMADIGQALVKNVLLRFETGKGPGGVPWKPSKRAQKTGGLTLVESGRLRTSITYQASTDAVEIGTNVKYAAIHQFGGDIQHYAYSRKVAFRSVTALVRDEAGTVIGRQVRNLFARTKGSRAHRGVTLKPVTYGERVVGMVARPFLGIDDADREDISAAVQRHLALAAGGAARP